MRGYSRQKYSSYITSDALCIFHWKKYFRYLYMLCFFNRQKNTTIYHSWNDAFYAWNIIQNQCDTKWIDLLITLLLGVAYFLQNPISWFFFISKILLDFILYLQFPCSIYLLPSLFPSGILYNIHPRYYTFFTFSGLHALFINYHHSFHTFIQISFPFSYLSRWIFCHTLMISDFVVISIIIEEYKNLYPQSWTTLAENFTYGIKKYKKIEIKDFQNKFISYSLQSFHTIKNHNMYYTV